MAKKDVMILGVCLLVVVSLLMVVQVYHFNGLTGFAVFSQNAGEAFSQGTYDNAEWDGSKVVLSSGTYGSYTSKVFDAGADATWNSLSYVGEEPSRNAIFIVDVASDLWKSTDSGVTWSLVKEDYNNGAANGAEGLVVDSTSLYIADGQDIWKSTDSGVTWSKINDDYNGAESYSISVFDIDKNDNLVIVDVSEQVWKSTNSGVSFVKNSLGYSAGASNAVGIAIDSSNNYFVVDGTSDVYKSTDEGVTWSLVKDDYNNGAANGADGLVADSTALYIADGQDIWKSTDSGVTWSKINDDFNGQSDTNNAKLLYVTSSNGMYIPDTSEDIYFSSDSGGTFNLVGSDVNGANGDVVGMTSLIESTTLSFEVKNCSQPDCSDGTWQTAELNNIDLTGIYFQYKVNFLSPDSSVTPSLESVEIDYDLINSAPSVSISRPSGILIVDNSSIALEFSVVDADGNQESCWYNLNNGENVSLLDCGNSSFSVADGSYTLRLWVNDSLGLVGTDSVDFDVDSRGVGVEITQPTGTKTSRTGIALVYETAGADLSCWYNVKTSVGGAVMDNTTIVDCATTEFSVSNDGDFVVNVFVNNSFGTSANASSSFTVDTVVPSNPAPSNPSSSGSSGSSGGGSTIGIFPVGNKTLNLGVVGDKDFLLKKGSSEDISFDVKNKERTFLNRCSLRGSGALSGLVKSETVANIGAGEEVTFSGVLEAHGVEPGVYAGSLEIKCAEGSYLESASVLVYRDVFEFEFLDYERVGTKLNVKYNLREFAKLDHEIVLSYELLDFDGLARTSGTKEFVLAAGYSGERVLDFELPKDSFGEFVLNIKLDDGVSSTFVNETVFLPTSTGLTGLAISEENKATITWVGILVLALVIAAFVLYYLRRFFSRKK